MINVEKLLLDLLAIDSQPEKGTAEISKFLEEILAENGFKVRKIRIDKKNFDLIAEKGKANLAVLAHMDTVAIGEGWSKNPFGEKVGNKIYGRGTADTKGGLASALSAALSSKNAFLIFTCREEIDLAGVFALKNEKIPARVLVTEPTSLKLGVAHKGIITMKIAFSGKKAHASVPWEGENAIYKACEFIGNLRKLKLRKNELGEDTYNVGVIKGGIAPNIVPDYCEILLDMRSVGDNEFLIEQIKTGEVLLNLPAFTNGKELADEIEKIVKIERTILPFYTEAGVLSMFGKKCAVFGPGETSMAHKTDEFVTTDQLRSAFNFYRKIWEAI